MNHKLYTDSTLKSFNVPQVARECGLSTRPTSRSDLCAHVLVGGRVDDPPVGEVSLLLFDRFSDLPAGGFTACGPPV